MKTERVEFNLRLTPALKALLEEKAKENHRSLNAECCVALQRHVRENWRG